MKLFILQLLLVTSVTVACSHEGPAPAASTPSTLPTQTALVSTAPTTEAGIPAIPTNNPAVPAPVAPAAAPPEQTPLVPSSGVGSARPVSAALVPSDPALDRAESTDDHESVREIRALLASDASLSPTARQITVVARNGRVWLRGQVNTPAERASIERAARKAANVIDVRNELTVLQ